MRILAIVFVFIMLMGFGASAYASYRGVGLIGDSTMSVRQGSSNGLFILGGGPGSGK